MAASAVVSCVVLRMRSSTAELLYVGTHARENAQAQAFGSQMRHLDDQIGNIFGPPRARAALRRAASEGKAQQLVQLPAAAAQQQIAVQDAAVQARHFFIEKKFITSIGVCCMYAVCSNAIFMFDVAHAMYTYFCTHVGCSKLTETRPLFVRSSGRCQQML